MLIEIRQNKQEELYINPFDPFNGCSDSSDDDIITVIDTERLRGRNYAEKKANLEAQAIDYSIAMSCSNLSYAELFVIGNYFDKYGRRFGLLTDFYENCIC